MRTRDEDVIGTRPPENLGPLFAQSCGPANVISEPPEVRAVRLREASRPRPRRPDDHAIMATQTDDAEKLLQLAERAANAILDAQGWMTVGLVRVHLAREKLLANDGTEKLDALGALGRRMGLVAMDTERQPKELLVTHGNRGTIWVRPNRLREYQEAHGRRGEAA